MSLSESLGQTNNLVEFLNYGVLVVSREGRVTHNVDEENVSDFQLDLFFNLGGHVTGRNGELKKSLRLEY